MEIEGNLAAAARSARWRLWAADSARYYAQKRFNQTETAKDRLIWQNCQKESKEALAAVQAAKEALAQLEGHIAPFANLWLAADWRRRKP